MQLAVKNESKEITAINIVRRTGAVMVKIHYSVLSQKCTAEVLATG